MDSLDDACSMLNGDIFCPRMKYVKPEFYSTETEEWQVLDIPNMLATMNKPVNFGIYPGIFKDQDEMVILESLETATKRITRFSTLGRPDGISALQNPSYGGFQPDEEDALSFSGS